MSVMKTLTINGKTYQVEGNPLIVTVEGSTASHTPAQMAAHVESGGSVALFYDNGYVPLTQCNDEHAYFSRVLDDCVLTCYGINENCLFDVEEGNLAKYDVMIKEIDTRIEAYINEALGGDY